MVAFLFDWLLNFVYVGVLLTTSPWLAYAGIRKGKYREGFGEKLRGRVPRRFSRRPCLWFHAVSVGEVNLLAPLLAEIARCRPDVECVISTTTMSGHALAVKKYPQCPVFYCPLDFSWAVRNAMARIRPTGLILVELELWPNLIRAAHREGAWVAVVNGRLSTSSYRGYMRLRPFVAPWLRTIDLIAAQNETYAQRFVALGANREHVHVTCSTKFDGAETDRNNPATLRLRRLAGIQDDDVVFLAGSTQPPEEALALKTYRTLRERFPKLRLILVPRHPNRFEAVARLLDRSGVAWQRRTALAEESAAVAVPACDPVTEPVPATVPLPSSTGARVLLVDTVGELGAWWGTAHIAFVGGSLGTRGGQNMIEPAAYGAAVAFGPKTRNFRDVVAALLANEAAEVVHGGTELTNFVRRALEDPSWASLRGDRAQAFVAGQLGATGRTVALLAGLLKPTATPSYPLQRVA